MDKEKAKALSKTLACYKELQENNSVNLIEFHTADGQKHGIGNPEAIKLLLSVAVIELERQLRTAQFGDIPESLENSREYKAAKQLEYAMNDLGFKSERFAQALPYFHKTLEQTFFRTVKASITAMAGRDSRCIDDRNLDENIFVTTYAYKPLVGLTSVKSPSGHTEVYEYSDNGKLLRVKDHKRNNIKSFEYNIVTENNR